MTRWIAFALAPLAAGCFNGLLLTPAHVGGPVEERVVTKSCRRFCRDKVALIDVDGLIVNGSTGGLFSSGDNPVSLFREKLDAAAADKRVKAVVLRINSPGGAVTASDIMYRDLCHFRETTQKPVVACMMDVAASGGYYLAMGCDRIYAHPTTVTGSIGVIMSLYNAAGLFKMVGVSANPIKSGPNKDIGNPGRPMTDAERAILQGMVTSFYDQFVEVVVHNRSCCSKHLTEGQVRALADGRVYTGLEAHRLGLVDEIGYLEDAIRFAEDMACIHDATVVTYDNCDGYHGSVYASAPRLPSAINVKLDVPGLSPPAATGFLYLWEPGLRR